MYNHEGQIAAQKLVTEQQSPLVELESGLLTMCVRSSVHGLVYASSIGGLVRYIESESLDGFMRTVQLPAQWDEPRYRVYGANERRVQDGIVTARVRTAPEGSGESTYWK